MGDDTQRCPGQHLVIARRRPEQKWNILLLCSFCLEINSKIFLASIHTTGGKHYALRWTMGGDTSRRPGQQMIRLCAAPDDRNTHSAPTQPTWRTWKPNCLFTLWKKLSKNWIQPTSNVNDIETKASIRQFFLYGIKIKQLFHNFFGSERSKPI